MIDMNIIENYNNAVNAIVEEFKKKHDISSTDEHWIGDQIGEIYDFGDCMIFNFYDILLDIKENAPQNEIFKWRDYGQRIWTINDMAGAILLDDINYRSWLKGCPHLTDEELDDIENKWKVLINETIECGIRENNSLTKF